MAWTGCCNVYSQHSRTIHFRKYTSVTAASVKIRPKRKTCRIWILRGWGISYSWYSWKGKWWDAASFHHCSRPPFRKKWANPCFVSTSSSSGCYSFMSSEILLAEYPLETKCRRLSFEHGRIEQESRSKMVNRKFMCNKVRHGHCSLLWFCTIFQLTE